MDTPSGGPTLAVELHRLQLPRDLAILDLPEHILTRCLEPLTQADRMRCAWPVCQRFRHACLALCATLDLQTPIPPGDAEGAAALPRTTSLHRFLQAHAPHVRCLSLVLGQPGIPPPLFGHAVALAAAVQGCLEACGAAGRLEQLTVAAPLATLAWLPGLTALSRLHLVARFQPLQLPAGVSCLTRLADLHLACWPLQLEESMEAGVGVGGPLPPSITRLGLDVRGCQELPHQLSCLASLARLDLHHSQYNADGMAVLLPAALPTLRTLLLSRAGALPACLPALSQVQCLVATVFEERPGGRKARELEQALASPGLQQLTALSMHSMQLARLPPALPTLARLQRLCIQPALVKEPLVLPLGPWLDSIRWLGMDWQSLAAAAATGVLGAAPGLEYVCCFGMPQPPSSRNGCTPDQWQAFWALLASHPPLRCLGIEGMKLQQAAGQPPDELARLHDVRPGMRQRVRYGPLATSFAEELAECADIPGD